MDKLIPAEEKRSQLNANSFSTVQSEITKIVNRATKLPVCIELHYDITWYDSIQDQVLKWLSDANYQVSIQKQTRTVSGYGGDYYESDYKVLVIE